MKTRSRAKGFTLVEVCLAMIVTAMIGSALAAFSLAVATQWRQSEQQQYLQVSCHQANGVVGPIVESSRAVGGVVTKYKPGVFLWQSDTYSGAADNKAQFCEMSLIEYDADLKTLFYYQGTPSTVTLAQTLAYSVLTSLQMEDPEIVELFKLQTAWQKPRRTLLGPGRVVDASLDITRVESAEFTAIHTGDLPAVKMNLTISRGKERVTLTDVYTLRAPLIR
jgi:hypothetical protein